MESNQAILDLLKIYSHALELATDGDKTYGMELLEQSCQDLDLSLPKISCNTDFRLDEVIKDSSKIAVEPLEYGGVKFR